MKTNLLPSVNQLINMIQENSPHNSKELATLVKSNPVIREEVLPFHSFDHCPTESYGRRELFRSNTFCIYLMSWCRGDFTAIHDHGATQWGCVLALDDFIHRLYQFNKNMLVLKDSRPFLKGQTASVYSNVIHMMGNPGKNNALSIHIYGTHDPSQKVAQNTRIFYPELGQITYTHGAAYMFNSENQPEKSYDFHELDEAAKEDYFNLMQQYRQSKSTFKTLH